MMDAPGDTTAQGAVMATSPAKRPFSVMEQSGFLNQAQEKMRADTAPAEAARQVVTQTRAMAKPLQMPPSPTVAMPVEAPLKPNQPKKRSSTPKAA